MPIKDGDNFTELTFRYNRVEKKVETLMDFLLRKFRYHDEEEWTEHIMSDRVLVDGRKVIPSQILQNNQTISYLRPDYLEPPVDRTFEVLYEDEDLIAVCKSGNLPTSPSGKYFKNTLVHLINESFDLEKIYTLHRLDRETSGVVLFAKHQQVAQIIAEQFRQKMVRKKYTGILQNCKNVSHFSVSMPIGPIPNCPIRIKQGLIKNGKPSKTHFYLKEKIGTAGKYEIVPLNGRTHQIRVHASYVGCPIVGDKLYALESDMYLKWLDYGDGCLEEINFPKHRHLLHASEIRFIHPKSQKELVIHADDQLLIKTFNESKINA